MKNLSAFFKGLHQSFKFIGLDGKRLLISIPALWSLIFFLIPFLIVFKISLSEPRIGAPPYAPIVEWVDQGIAHIHLNFSHYLYLLKDKLYIISFFVSIMVAGAATLICLLIGYPMAYAIARSSAPWRLILIILVILPFWTSFIIRVYAWMMLLSPQGIINTGLMKLGLITQPLELMNNHLAVCLGIVYSYLPFMILPLFAVLEKIDLSLLEAASDLGCTPMRSFRSITLPLSTPGIVAGSVLVFIPAMGEFVIPELLGGSACLMIGKVLWIEFFANRNWPIAAAVAILLLIFVVIPVMWFQNVQNPVKRGLYEPTA